MKKYSLTLTVRKAKDSFDVASVDSIESDSLLEVMAQLPLIVARITKLEINNLERHIVTDDDIPF